MVTGVHGQVFSCQMCATRFDISHPYSLISLSMPYFSLIYVLFYLQLWWQHLHFIYSHQCWLYNKCILLSNISLMTWFELNSLEANPNKFQSVHITPVPKQTKLSLRLKSMMIMPLQQLLMWRYWVYISIATKVQWSHCFSVNQSSSATKCL